MREIKYFTSSVRTIFRKFAGIMYRLHKKFDKMPENRRFLTFLGFMMLGIVGFNTHDLHGNIYITAVGGVYMIILALSRIAYVDGWLKNDE